jgi:MFS family permease
MSDDKATKRRHFTDLTPLRQSPAFARLWIGSVIAGVGAQLTIVAVGLQIYAITESTAAVAAVGGIALIPMILAGPLGGMAADAFDRRLILIIAAVIMFTSTAGLLTLSVLEVAAHGSGGHVAVWPFYIFTTFSTMASTVMGAARSASYPRILPVELIPSASALTGLSMGTQIMVGPALAGVLVASVGFPLTFAADLIFTSAGFLGIITLPKLPPLSEVARPGWTSFRQGLDFLRTVPQVSAGFVIDIIAMGFGRPYVLLPAVAVGIIGGGPITVGIITAAGAAGSFATSVFSGRVRFVQRQGLAIGRAVEVYGLFVLLFGAVLAAMSTGAFGHPGEDFSEVNGVALALGSLAFFGMGASDEVSAIFRSSMLLTIVPDDMRGRLQGVFFAVVTGGPRIGDIYAGVVAGLTVIWFPPALGGILIAVAVAAIVRFTPTMRNYRVDSAPPAV